MPQFFKRWQPKPAVKRRRIEDRYRGAPVERGYDAKWDRLSSRFKRDHPFCAECSRRGRIELGHHVDHMIPIADAPDLRLDPDNLQTLCISCHNGWKRRMEAYARKAGTVDLLAEWCRSPEKRPKVFQFQDTPG